MLTTLKKNNYTLKLKNMKEFTTLSDAKAYIRNKYNYKEQIFLHFDEMEEHLEKLYPEHYKENEYVEQENVIIKFGHFQVRFKYYSLKVGPNNSDFHYSIVLNFR